MENTSTTIIELFRKQVKCRPDHTAIVCGEQQLTYREVDAFTDSIAMLIKERGIGEEDVVAVLIHRNLFLALIPLAVAKAGCAYLALDYSYPEERIRWMMEDASVKLLFADTDLLEMFGDLSVPVFTTDYINEQRMSSGDDAVEADVSQNSLLSIIYTSGSTGVPKGCMITRQNVVELALSSISAFNLEPNCRHANYASFSFIPSVLDIFSALLAGATLYIVPEEIRYDFNALENYFNDNAITSTFMTTQVARQFVLSCQCPALKTIMGGGEKLSAITPPEGLRFLNGYGSSECVGLISCFEVKTAMENTPVGRPAGNFHAYIVDSQGLLVPDGNEGELWLSGPQLCRGYFNREEQTSSDFTSNPFEKTEGYERVFHTGDIVKKDYDGNIVFACRKDNMVKIRGYRIELGEIEHVILQYPDISSAVVTTFDDGNGGLTLAAYFVADKTVDIDALTSFISEVKPQYMVPAFITQLPQLPLNTNMKVDKAALPMPQITGCTPSGDTEFSESEKEIAQIVENVMSIEALGLDSLLRYAGLTSIMAMRIASLLFKRYGVQIDAKTILKEGSIRSLSVMVETNKIISNRQEITDSADELPLSAPLTSAQTGIYIECASEPETVTYNIPFVVRFPDRVKSKQLAEAIKDVINVHPLMKAHFEVKGDDIIQVLDLNQNYNILQKQMNAEELDAYFSEFVRPFNLQTGPLYRFEIIECEQKTVLLFDVHHLIFDGSSVDLLIRQVCNRLDGIMPESESLSYLQFALMQKKDTEEASKAFLKEVMQDYENATEIPVDRKNEQGKTGVLQRYVEHVEWKPIHDFCNKQDITPAHLLLAATIYTASRYTNSRDIYLCSVSSGRGNLKLADTTGMFVNTLPVHGNIGEGSVLEFLQQTRDRFELSLKHEDYPFAKIAAEYDFKPQISFVYQAGLLSRYIIGNETVHVKSLETRVPKFKLQIQVFEGEIHILYDDAYYSQQTIGGLAESLHSVVNHFMENADKRLRNVSIMSENQKAFVEGIRYGGKGEPKFRLFYDSITHWAKVKPEETALVACDASFSYAEMDDVTSNIANALAKMGVKLGDRVALLLPRTSRLILSMFGVQKAGAAYIPCDPEYPEDRVKLILEDSEARFIITTDDRLNSVPEGKGVDVETLLAPVEGNYIHSEPTPDDLAYLIYTSGSTGRPKGVMLRHEGVCNYSTAEPANVEAYAVANAAKTVLGVTTISFDASLHEIGISLFNGLTLVLADEEQTKNPMMMAELIRKHHIGYVSATPSQWQTWIYSNEFVEAIKKVPIIRFGGEKLPESLLHQMQELTPSRIINTYGPTETTVSSNIQELTSAERVTVGHPQFNVVEFIVDCDGNELPVGVVGELYIGGKGVGRGYNKLDEMTNERFVDYHGTRISKSGDYAKWLPDGDVVILGRTDHQIKLRGLRIELGEIETAISNYPGVRQTVVMIRKLGGVEHLCAYYTADMPIDPNDLRSGIAKHLTEYMVPTAYLQMEKMPMTPNGKTDVKSLPEPQLAGKTGSAANAPRQLNRLEKEIVYILSGILGTEDIDIEAPLNTLGITSLTAIRLAVQIQQKFNVLLNAKQLVKNGTVLSIEDSIISHLLKKPVSPNKAESTDEKILSAPLSFAQTGVYFECMKAPTEIIYNIPFKMKMPEGITPDQLKQAVIDVVKCHHQFGIHFDISESMVTQTIDVEQTVKVGMKKMSEEMLKEYCKQFVQPFNLKKGPLYRFEVVETPENVYLLGDIHHLIFDGGSHDLFNQQICMRLEGKAIDEEKYTLIDFTIDEQKADQTDAKAFFDEQMKECEGATDIPADLKSGAKHGKLKWTGAPFDLDGLTEFCKRENVTPATVTLAAAMYTIARYANSYDVYISTISNGRSNLKISNTMGMFVNTLPLAAHIKDGSVMEFIRNTAEIFEKTISFEQYPFAQIADSYGFRPNISFAYQLGVMNETKVNGKPINIEPLDLDVPKFKIDIFITMHNNVPEIRIGFDDAFYSEGFIRQLCENMATVVSHFIQNKETPVRNISMLNEKQCREIIAASAGKPLDVDINRTFANSFSIQAEKTPDRLAVADDKQELTYGEMERRANILADKLIKAGVKADSFVAVGLERTVLFPITVLAIHKAGAAYLPLDLEYPNERLQYMMEDSKAPILVTTHDVLTEKRKGGEFKVANIILLDDMDWTEDVHEIDKSKPEGLAYIIYTSGSTGKPKGAMLHQAGLSNFIASVIDFTSLNKDDRIAHHRSFSFDAHIEDLYPVLTLGGSLHIMPSDIRKDLQKMYQFIMEHKITGGGYATPMAILMLNNFDLPVRYITAGGDKLAGVKSDHIDIINVYGPTECTDDTNYYIMQRGKDYDNIPIGTTIPNCWSFITDPDGNLLPNGVAGELCFAGIQVGYGYWNMPERTQKSFVDCPFVSIDRFGRKVKMYHTGDLCKYNRDGLIEFIGRIDNQVKVNGFRIELGEIESIASQFDGISEVAATVKTIGVGKHICLFYTAKENLSQDELTEHIQNSSLAQYMQPDVYVRLDEMPHTPSGKINVKALPTPDLKALKKYVAPRNATEEKLCSIFADTLQLERVGINDDFFALGGTSLIATRAVIDIVNAGYNITYGDLFKYKTPAALSAFLEGDSKEEDETDILNRLLSDYDYRIIDNLLQKNSLEAFNSEEMEAFGNVLLTGSTGFLGIHVLYELMRREDVETITCLIRGENTNAAENRLRTMLFYYFGNAFKDEFGKRLFVVCGNVTDSFDEMIERKIDIVFNCAANVKHFSKGTDIEDVNIGGAERCIDFCIKRGAKLIHVSTMSTAGVMVDSELSEPPVFNEQKLFIGQRLNTKYSWSKFVAERKILKAVATQELRAKIMRVGSLSARSTDGEFQINFQTNSSLGRLRIYKMLGALPYCQYDMPIEFSPINQTALAIVILAQTPDSCVVFHPFNHHRELLGDILERMKNIGFKISLVDEDEFQRRMNEAKKDPEKAEKMSGLIAYVNAAHGRQTVVPRTVNQFTMQVLYRLQFKWDMTTWDYIDRMFATLHGFGYFNESNDDL